MSDNPLLVAPRSTKITIYGGDVERELDELLDRIDQAEAEAASDKRKKAIADQLAAEYDEKRAAANGVEFAFEAITDAAARQLQDDCPKRKGNAVDETWGFNLDDFLLAYARAGMQSPKVTDRQWGEFVDQATSSNLTAIRAAALDLFTEGVDLGKLSAASVLQRRRALATSR